MLLLRLAVVDMDGTSASDGVASHRRALLVNTRYTDVLRRVRWPREGRPKARRSSCLVNELLKQPELV